MSVFYTAFHFNHGGWLHGHTCSAVDYRSIEPGQTKSEGCFISHFVLQPTEVAQSSYPIKCTKLFVKQQHFFTSVLELQMGVLYCVIMGLNVNKLSIWIRWHTQHKISCSCPPKIHLLCQSQATNLVIWQILTTSKQWVCR